MKTLTTFSICTLLLLGTSSRAAALDRVERSNEESSQPASPPVNPVVQWNRVLLTIVRTPGAQPATIHPTRSFAILHAAIFDAVNAIDNGHKPYAVRVSDASPGASQDAAAAAAAHDVLVGLYPQFQSTLDQQLQASLAQISDQSGVADGIRIGQIVASRMLALRQNDGSAVAPIPYVFGTDPGDYQSTPPNFPPQPQFTHWSRVSPFALTRADVFRPGQPPALTSDRYGDALNEVKALGMASGTVSSPDQALTGRFWNGAIQNYWNEITQSITDTLRLSTAERARLFALTNLAFADTVIAFYDAKYTYNFWRPVTAIRAADTAGNTDNTSDPTWLPEVGNTTPDPSYPGAHAAVSAAALDVLLSVLRRDRFDLTVTSEVLPGVTRSFTSLSAAADE
ncbi:MAG TPA: vanadium-dependent haloperoxidase, partial [Vicinamibacterales bacterium]|nr:vanadium-dependent haloperoxidase [Vicinamibacterales bacterium]